MIKLRLFVFRDTVQVPNCEIIKTEYATRPAQYNIYDVFLSLCARDPISDNWGKAHGQPYTIIICTYIYIYQGACVVCTYVDKNIIYIKAQYVFILRMFVQEKSVWIVFFIIQFFFSYSATVPERFNVSASRCVVCSNNKYIFLYR